MNPWLSGGIGALTGYVILGFSALWVRNACLPVSGGKIGMALFAVAVLFAGHAVVPLSAARRRPAG